MRIRILDRYIFQEVVFAFMFTVTNAIFIAPLQCEVTAEIKFFGNVAVGNFVGGTFKQNFALVQDIGAVDNVQGLADVVVGYQNTHAALAQVSNNFLNIGDG